jgi:hypothetical protein
MALKKAFLGTDEDLLSSKSSPESVFFFEKFITPKKLTQPINQDALPLPRW